MLSGTIRHTNYDMEVLKMTSSLVYIVNQVR